ncbi:MAG: PAS domain S-box protein [Candidatus Electrothrix sp. ATG2]|nr:PAS domain S-box protein [Candidatus Electrothrix sp. ATG2]
MNGSCLSFQKKYYIEIKRKRKTDKVNSQCVERGTAAAGPEERSGAGVLSPHPTVVRRIFPMQSELSNASVSQEKITALEQQVTTLNEELAYYKKISKALQKDHSFRKGVIDRAAEGVCVCHEIPESPHVRFTVWNARMVDITGHTLEEINTKGWYQVMYPDSAVQEKAIKRMNQMREGKDLRGERWEVVRADGEKRILSISTSVLRTDDGVTHVLGLMLDVTKQERYHQHLETILNELKTILNRSFA